MSDIEYAVDGAVATIRLNRPEVKNAFTVEMADAWADHLEHAARDDDVRVLIVTGTGRAFCGGGDLGRLAERRSPLETRERLTKHVHRVALAVDRLDKPVIAAVNGDAFGAGMDMALMCDLGVAAASARFSDGYILAGLVPGDGACYYLPRLAGTARALELLLTGATISASEAERYGIVNRVVPDDQLTETVGSLAAELAARDPVLVQTIKRCVYQSAGADLRTSLDLAAAQLAVLRSTEASEEAFRTFRDQRRRPTSS